MEYEYTIYKLFFDGDERVYIGKTRHKLNKRRNSHIQMIKRGIHTNRHLCEALHKYGQDAMVVEALETCSHELSCEREIYWMKYFDATNKDKGYNISLKSNGSIAFTLTQDQKNKISKARKGSSPSLEHRQRLRQANLGKTLSETTKDKIRNWYKDMGGWNEEQKKLMAESASYPRSEETKARMSHGTETKYAESRGCTLNEWRKIKSDAINDWKVNGMSVKEVSEKYRVDKSMLYDWYKKLNNNT